MQAPDWKPVVPIATNNDRLERYRALIARELHRSVAEEIRHPPVPISPSEEEELAEAAMMRVNVMMSAARMYCTLGNPPRARIETSRDEFGVVVKCRHRPPHFYDENFDPMPES